MVDNYISPKDVERAKRAAGQREKQLRAQAQALVPAMLEELRKECQGLPCDCMMEVYGETLFRKRRVLRRTIPGWYLTRHHWNNGRDDRWLDYALGEDGLFYSGGLSAERRALVNAKSHTPRHDILQSALHAARARQGT